MDTPNSERRAEGEKPQDGRREAVSRGVRAHSLIGLPSVVLIVLWAGLWFMWPRDIRGRPRTRAPWQPGVSYVVLSEEQRGALHRQPHLFALPSAIGFSPRNSDPAREDRPWFRAAEPRFLGRSVAAELPRAVPVPVAALSPGELQIPAARFDVFTGPADSERRLLVHMSPALARARLELPALAGRSALDVDEPWEVVVHVRIGEQGRVGTVFLVQGSGKQEIDAEVIRAIYEGRVPSPSGATAGRVTVAATGARKENGR